MKAAILEPPQQLIITELPQPELPVDGGLIRVTGCGLCGSDMDKILYRDTPRGTVLGHEVVGVIHALSEEARVLHPQLTIGQRVSVAHHVPCQTCHYCRHGSPSMCRMFKTTNIIPGGFSEIIAVSGDHLAHTVQPIPNGISDEAAICIEPLACCLRAVNRVPQSSGNTILVIGLGFIGLMTAQALRLKGFRVFGIDLKPDRVELAENYTMVDWATTDPGVLKQHLHLETEDIGVDTVFLSMVTPATVGLAFQSVRDGGNLMLFSSYGPGTPILNQNEIYFRELTVDSSYSPALADLKEAHHLITQNKINVAPLISHHYPLSELNTAVEAYRSGEAMKVFVSL